MRANYQIYGIFFPQSQMQLPQCTSTVLETPQVIFLLITHTTPLPLFPRPVPLLSLWEGKPEILSPTVPSLV